MQHNHPCDLSADLYGWRAWDLTDTGRLVSPIYRDVPFEALPAIEGGVRGGRFVEAQCKHGNQVPSKRCPCGMHYSNSVPHIRMFTQRFSDAAERHTPHLLDAPRRWALSFGVAERRCGRSSDLPSRLSKRARRYYPLGICLPESDPALEARVRAHYGVKVVNSTSNQALLSLERFVRKRLTKRGIPATVVGSIGGGASDRLAPAALRGALGERARAPPHSGPRLL